jgi:hypothetical protein
MNNSAYSGLVSGHKICLNLRPPPVNDYRRVMLIPGSSINMTAIFNRIVELMGWIVLGVSTILLVFASHIDNYQPPEQSVVVQKK